ncbi:MAG: L,D-transpeptidase [Chelatococcus sp.]|jgi:lipoprotein-anchoring transpeptidase ErfK/SrfK|uniref:L,D-transpeptidase n=1 Tax=unclassified Chelatococcus TaxID=2638111 RepID=UPI001BCFFFD1|nr:MULTISPECIES: L,D-transpeptidase [unclassified Chelatococcus]CAH1649283.1 Lipoprotein-anchoring transpeptidase ErfK/SrfK [Hyphomicrobiales bacterium]MBS7739587.1 L,D-transpeptidase [Chelatococcus sp. HY11]MBX3537604.1 L,D-transpeptidase [Chelatococcus sp.]MBX3543956.1 L,D-transpeptidase [Chelatococcus sp.]MCO5075876.1 L,D-transpeptidase [Chelatococcus sp.]
MRHRQFLPAVALTLSLFVPSIASAQQGGYPASNGNLGGGFLEFLATGGRQGGTQAPEYFYQPAPPPGSGSRAGRAAHGDQYLPVQRDPLTDALNGPARGDYYGSRQGGGYDGRYQGRRMRTANVPPDAIDSRRSYAPQAEVASRLQRQEVAYDGKEKAGTIIVDTRTRYLYLVQPGGRAMRYGIGVGREGFTWKGRETVSMMREWPSWRPPAEMRKRRPDLPRYMEGGPNNPLGARALYLGNTLFRIHGTNEPHTIGRAVSSGCIRMMNNDVIDLYNRVGVGTRVVVS